MGKKGSLFNRNWIFVENVVMDTKHIVFYFNEPATECLIFPVRVEIMELPSEIIYQWEDLQYCLSDNNKLEISLNNMSASYEYEVKLFFEDQLMFADKYINSDEIPF